MIKLLPAINNRKIKEMLILAMLSLVQFTFLVDYLLLLPIGPHLVKNLHLDYKDLSLLISAYTFSAAISGFTGIFFFNKFDRKKILLFACVGFCAGPFLAVFSDSFIFLLIARILSGGFGGVMSSLIMVIIADVVPETKLGRATSFIVAANGVASILGIPLSIFLLDRLGWQYPFIFLGVITLVLLLLITTVMPALEVAEDHEDSAFEGLKMFFSKKKSIWTIVFISLLTFAGGFTILPFLSSYMIHNFSFNNVEVSFLFFLGGIASFVAGPLAGHLSDKFGKQNVFLLLNFLSVLPIIFVTIYPLDSKVFAITATTLFFMFSTARHVTGTTLVNYRLHRIKRGQFIGISNSVQMLSGTTATMVAGHIVQMEEGMLVNFDILGIIAVCAAFLGFFTAFGLEDSKK